MRTLTDFTINPAAALFPMIPEDHDDFRSLRDSIEADGLLEPIVIDGTELIDGRNRLRACEVAGVEPRFIEWSTLGWTKSKSRWVSDKNFARRHLTDDQKAVVWDKLNPLIDDEERAMEKAATQFKAGQSGNPTGKAKEQVNTISCSPAKRDTKAMHKRSRVGKLAEGAGVSHHKAAQVVKVKKAVEQGALPPQTMDEIQAGTLKLKDAVKRLPTPDDDERPRVMSADEVMQKVGRCPVDGAIQFAAAAIAQLEEIADDDPDRNQALKRVQCYLEQRAGKASKAKPSKALRLMSFWWGKADRKDQALFWETTVSGGAL